MASFVVTWQLAQTPYMNGPGQRAVNVVDQHRYALLYVHWSGTGAPCTLLRAIALHRRTWLAQPQVELLHTGWDTLGNVKRYILGVRDTYNIWRRSSVAAGVMCPSLWQRRHRWERNGRRPRTRGTSQFARDIKVKRVRSRGIQLRLGAGTHT